MTLALEVTHPHRADTVLLRPNAALDAFNIPKLRELGVREIWIKYPGLEDLVRYADPMALASYRAVVDSVGGAMDKAMAGGGANVEYHQYRDAVMALLHRLAGNPSSALLVTELGAAAGPAARHAGNTCFVSLMLGIKLDYYLIRERTRMSAHSAKDLSSLGIGAMFHDIGFARLAPEDLSTWRETRHECDPGWMRHVQLGYDMVKDHLDASAAGVVLHHHQHFDGSGFPHRTDTSGHSVPLRGSEIHVYARIAACAELYDRARYGTFLPGDEDEPPRPVVAALAMLRRPPYRNWIDPVILRMLHQVVPAYPPGIMVELSDGRRGAVAEWNSREPCRPTILIVPDPAARPRKEAERVDLLTAPDLHIARVDDVDVTGCNFLMRNLTEARIAA